MNYRKVILIGMAVAIALSLLLYWLLESWMVGVAAFVGISIGILSGLRGKDKR